MKQAVIVIAIALLIIGCTAKKPVVELRTETHYIELVRDSTIIIPADSAWLEALLECDSLGNVYMKQLLGAQSGKHVQPPAIQLHSNVLTTTSRVDSFGVFYSWVEKYGLGTREIPVYVEELIEVPVRGWIWWVGITTVIAGTALGVGYAARKSGLLKWIKRVFKII